VRAWTAALRIASFVAGLLVGLPAAAAEESIAISDSLAANADELAVKQGGQGFGQIFKWRIGEHAVISSKLHTTNVTTKSNLLKTKTERHSTTEFAFIMCNPTSDSVSVTAVRRVMDESTSEFKLGKHLGLGENGLLHASDSCTATIVVSGDTAQTWTFLKASISAPQFDWAAYLSDGTRRVLLSAVTANARSDSTHRGFFSQFAAHIIPPAMGYEFFEDGRSICALQTFGGRSRKNPRRVWMHRGLDARMKLVLAAAMTTVLQIETSSTGLEPPDEDSVH
jgi:hypothetical protein